MRLPSRLTCRVRRLISRSARRQHIFLQRRTAAQQCLHPDRQFRHRHRLDDIIVGAGLEILHLAFQLAARGQDQHRHGVAHLAHAPQQAVAGAVRQLQIQDHQVVVIGLEIFERVRSRADAIHGIAFAPQAALKDIDEFLLVFDNQDAHRVCRLSAAFPGR